MADETDYDPAEVRAWAAAQGLDVAPGGRLRAEVVAAWLARDDDSGEPDWGAAGTAGEDPEGAQDPAPPAAEAAAADSTGTGPPPPADLSEARKRAREDSGGKRARPGWAGRGRATRDRDRAQPPKVTKAVQGDIEGKLALLLAVPVTTWAAVDPYCGGVMGDNLDSIVRKATPLICQSPQAVKWFTEGGIYLLWLDLALAVQPVAVAAWRHHVAGTVTIIDGQPVPSRRGPDGRVVPLAQPAPQQAPDYSAYTTHVAGHVPQPRPA